MAGEILVPAISGGALLTIFIGILVKHTSNGKKHPDSDELVYKDVCVKCQEVNAQAHEHLKGAVSELKKDTKEGFEKMESHIDGVFERIELLILKDDE